MAGRGGKRSTSWVKGQSGNPGGRPKALRDVIDLARQHTPAAIKALAEALKDPDKRVAAAVALLDRGWGKPVQAIDSRTEIVTGGIDAPPRTETVEEWVARRDRELASVVAATGTAATRH